MSMVRVTPSPEAQITMLEARLEAVRDALEGEPVSEFMLSFSEVQMAKDMHSIVDRLTAVLLQVQDANTREEWEPGPTLTEAMDRVQDELHNQSCDPYSEQPEDLANAKRFRDCNYEPWKL